MPARTRIVYTLALMLAACGGNDAAKAALTDRDAGATPGQDAAADAQSSGTSDAGSGGAGGSSGHDAGNAGADAGGDAGGSGGGRVSIFVAQGHKGRLMISCDDGRTWTADRNDDDTVHCFDSSATDCDHDPGAARGLAHGNGYFVATFGWGLPGHIARSKNGVDWEEFPQTKTFADLAFGHGLFVANDPTPAISSDGESWMDGGHTVLSVANVRAIAFVAKNGGRFVVTGETGTAHDVVISKDDGKSWVHPTTLPAACGANVTGLTASDDIVLIAQGGGRVCTSADGGDTWKETIASQGFTSPPVWTGSEFMIWQNATLLRSPDGTTWTSAALTPANVHIGIVAVNAKGTFVAVNADWNSWYDKQAFYRSEDGVSWDVLPSTAFKGGHPIYFMEAGDVEASAKCPAP